MNFKQIDNDKQKGLGDRFYQHARKTINQIQKNASKYEVKYHINELPVRWQRVSKDFPFLIHYVIKKEMIIILGVLHETSEHQKHIEKRS